MRFIEDGDDLYAILRAAFWQTETTAREYLTKEKGKKKEGKEKEGEEDEVYSGAIQYRDANIQIIHRSQYSEVRVNEKTWISREPRVTKWANWYISPPASLTV